MKKLLLALALLLTPVSAIAQCNGVFPSNTVCGSVSGGSPKAIPFINFPATIIVGTTPIQSGITNGLLYTNGSVLGNLATGNNGVLITDGLGVPAIATTLPSGLSIPSPALTGLPTAPTQSTGDNTTKIATNQFVQTAVANPPAVHVYNVKLPPYNAVCDGVTNDTTAIASAVTAAIAAKGTVYIPSGNCLANVTVQDVSGISFVGDGYLASVITAPNNSNALDIFSNIGSGSVNNISVSNLKLVATGTGIALRVWNATAWTLSNVYTQGPIGISIQGSGFGLLNNVQAYGGGTSALSIGNGAGALTNSGPISINGGVSSVNGNSGSAIVITGDPLGIVFNGCYIQANNTPAASVTLDGPSAGTPNGSVDFYGCHGESNFNTGNTGADFLIGATHKFGHVGVYGGNFWGHGDGTNYQRDWMRVVSIRDVVVHNVTASKLTATNGYSRSMIRLETSSADAYNFQSLLYDGSGSMYSDANSVITTAGDAFSGPNYSVANGVVNPASLSTPAVASLAYKMGANLLGNSTAPIATTFCGTSPSIPANNGTAAFTINVGTSCSTSVGTVTMPAATTGWVCHFDDITSPATNNPKQTGGTQTTVTLTNYSQTTGSATNWTASEILRAQCTGY